MDRVELIIRDTNLPICPKCGNGNAMLYKHDPSHVYYYCRDCGYMLIESDVVLVYTILDKPGMGSLSTYTEIERRYPK